MYYSIQFLHTQEFLQGVLTLDESFFSSPGRAKAAKAAATVLCNMFQYKKLHSSYKQVRKL